MDRTIGSRSNCARNSCVPDPARAADAAAAATASSLAQTRTARPSTCSNEYGSFPATRVLRSIPRTAASPAKNKFAAPRRRAPTGCSVPPTRPGISVAPESPALISATCSCEIPIACGAAPFVFAGIPDSSASTTVCKKRAPSLGGDSCAAEGGRRNAFVSPFGCAGIGRRKRSLPAALSSVWRQKNREFLRRRMARRRRRLEFRKSMLRRSRRRFRRTEIPGRVGGTEQPVGARRRGAANLFFAGEAAVRGIDRRTRVAGKDPYHFEQGAGPAVRVCAKLEAVAAAAASAARAGSGNARVCVRSSSAIRWCGPCYSASEEKFPK